MSEIIIKIEKIDPVSFFGIDNENVNLMQSHYPELRLIVRANEIKAYGDSKSLDAFEKKINLLVDRFSDIDVLTQDNFKNFLTIPTKEIEKFKFENNVLLRGVGGSFIRARTINQQHMVKSMERDEMLFAIGPAGTGKTYIALAMAVKSLREKEVKKIILTRPAVESGKKLGFLPGDVKEKLDPYMKPLYDALQDMIPVEKLGFYFEKEIIEIAPLAFMRGRTLNHSFVILDEAQNTTRTQMKMFLTRMGKGSKFLITGDPQQVDLPKNETSSLKEILSLLKEIKGISQVYLDSKDVIRHDLVEKIIEMYNKLD